MFLVATTFVYGIGSAHAAWPDHTATAEAYDAAILPANNHSGSPSTLVWDGSGALQANTVCGGYVALLLRNTYTTVTSTVLRGLTGSSSPNSKQWNDAIEGEASYTSGAGTFAFVARASVDDVAVGDVVAAEYTSGGGTGHTMVVADLWLDAAVVVTTIPGVPLAERWVVSVYDSTTSPHGSTDSRWLADAGPAHDQGVGSGELYLYADPSTGALVGWTWSQSSAIIYQGTDATAASYRPLVAGSLTGPSL